MVLLLLEPGGLYYDLEIKEIAALRPRPAFLLVMWLIEGLMEYKEATGTLVTSEWRRRNRRVSTALSPILYLFQIPTSTLSRKLQIVLSQEVQPPLVIETQRRPGPKDIPYGILADQWPTVLHRVLESHESYCKVADDYGVSRETIRRMVRAIHNLQAD